MGRAINQGRWLPVGDSDCFSFFLEESIMVRRENEIVK